LPTGSAPPNLNPACAHQLATSSGTRPSRRPIRAKRAAIPRLFARNVDRDLSRLENRGVRRSFREGAGLKTAMSALRHRGFTIEPCPSLAESPPCRPLSDQEAMRRRRLPSMLSPSGVQVSTRKVKCVLVVLMSAFVERHLRLPPRTDGLLLLRSSSARRYLFGVAGPATARFAFRPFPDKITSPAATPHAGPTLLLTAR
jgi:hypothetical protein